MSNYKNYFRVTTAGLGMLTGIYIFKDWRVSLIFLSLILGVLNLSLILIIAEEIDS